MRPTDGAISIVVPVNRPVAVMLPVQRGPEGPRGVGAGGISFIQDHEPAGAAESDTWWNPLTLQLKVFHNDAFEPVSPDGGHF